MSAASDSERGEGFWTFVRRTRPVNDFDDETKNRIEKRQRLVCTRGFGVNYDWITVPLGHTSNNGGQYDWASVDHYFGGVNREEFDEVISRFSVIELKREDGAGAVMNIPYLDVISYDKTGFMDYEDYRIIPDHLFKSESSNLPKPQAMEGTYDIIYYSGDASYFLGVHYRTARGTVVLSTFNSEQGTPVIKGSVTMHPCMEEIDVIPFGGNYSFVEKARVQREGRNDDRDDDDEQPSQPTGVIKIQAQPPEGLCTNDGRRAWSEKEIVHEGELRIFREKVGAAIANQFPRRPSMPPLREVFFNSTEDAEELNKEHSAKTCSWLHKYTMLDESACSKIGEFVCPPPVLFFMEGDIQIDINWRNIAPQCHSANSYVIARRRSGNATARPSLMVSNQNKYEREMSLAQAEINKLEQMKDMIWLAYFCADMVSASGSLRVSIPYFWSGGPKSEKLDRCFTYMDQIVFSEQLMMYGLSLENIQLIHHGRVSERRINFTRN